MIELIILSLSFSSIFISTFVFQEKTILFISQTCLAVLSFIALYRLYEADVAGKTDNITLTKTELVNDKVDKQVNQENVEKYDALKEKFMSMADQVKSPAGDKESDVWDVVLTRSTSKKDSIYKIQVQQKKKCDFTFRIVAEMVLLHN